MPDIIVAIGTGGFIPARIIKTYLKKDILVVGVKRYDETGDDNANGNLSEATNQPQKIQWIDEAERKISNRRILLIDEVDDTRLTMSYCINELFNHSPAEIRVAVLHQKIKPKMATYPDSIKHIYSGAETEDIWIKYPWESTDIDKHNLSLDS